MNEDPSEALGHWSPLKRKEKPQKKATWQKAQRLWSDVKLEPKPPGSQVTLFSKACQSPMKQTSPEGHLYCPFPGEVIQPGLNVEAWGFKIHYLMLIRKKKTNT